MASPVCLKKCSSPIVSYKPVFLNTSSGWLPRPEISTVPCFEKLLTILARWASPVKSIKGT